MSSPEHNPSENTGLDSSKSSKCKRQELSLRQMQDLILGLVKPVEKLSLVNEYWHATILRALPKDPNPEELVVATNWIKDQPFYIQQIQDITVDGITYVVSRKSE